VKKNDQRPSEAEMAVKKLTRELTRGYVHVIVKEATKRALTDRSRRLSDKKLSKLEKNLKELSDEQKLQKFEEALNRAAREIESGKGGKADLTERIGNILEKPLRGSRLTMAVKLSMLAVVPAAAVMIYFLLFPLLGVSPDPIYFSFDLPVGGHGHDWIYISNHRGGDLEWTARCDQPWVSLSPGYGGCGRGTTDRIRISVDASDLPAGRHEGRIIITSNGGDRSGWVFLNLIEEPKLSIEPNPPSYQMMLEAGKTGSEKLQIDNSGTGNLRWTATSNRQWLSLRPSSGTNYGSATVNVDAKNLDPGRYDGSITIESNGGSREATVDLEVTRPPRLQIDKKNLNFRFEESRYEGVSEGEPAPQSFRIYNAGEGVLSWYIESDQPWLTISPVRGTNSGSVSVSVNTARLKDDSTASFLVSSNGGSIRGTVEVKIIHLIG